MTITRLGELSLGAVVPMLGQFRDALAVSAAISIPELQAQIGGLGNVLAAITVSPPDLGGTITAALATVAQLQAALSVSGPTITLQAAAIGLKLVELTDYLTTLTAAVDIEIPDGTLTAYVFDGASGDIGAELQAEVNDNLPGAPSHANALILVTTSPTDWTAAAEVFAT